VNQRHWNQQRQAINTLQLSEQPLTVRQIGMEGETQWAELLCTSEVALVYIIKRQKINEWYSRVWRFNNLNRELVSCLE
jgi:hypothetical protein